MRQYAPRCANIRQGVPRCANACRYESIQLPMYTSVSLVYGCLCTAAHQQPLLFLDNKKNNTYFEMASVFVPTASLISLATSITAGGGSTTATAAATSADAECVPSVTVPTPAVLQRKLSVYGSTSSHHHRRSSSSSESNFLSEKIDSRVTGVQRVFLAKKLRSQKLRSWPFYCSGLLSMAAAASLLVAHSQRADSSNATLLCISVASWILGLSLLAIPVVRLLAKRLHGQPCLPETCYAVSCSLSKSRQLNMRFGLLWLLFTVGLIACFVVPISIAYNSDHTAQTLAAASPAMVALVIAYMFAGYRYIVAVRRHCVEKNAFAFIVGQSDKEKRAVKASAPPESPNNSIDFVIVEAAESVAPSAPTIEDIYGPVDIDYDGDVKNTLA
ncbi:hypothetical protein GQ42DRAFT_61993 [Ramicandelaber brevisporus]|nr:hypothetical protein GQ42DRAFT_61993 [Ramicandelaber brevisporus]